MKAIFQPLSGIIRVGPDLRQYGKWWDYSLTLSSYDPDFCALLALKSDGNFGFSHQRAIRAVVKGLGFRRVIWDRYDEDGVKRPVEFKV